MNRNVESHFSELPSIDIQRSTFDRSSEHIFTANISDCVPFFIDEVLPGDTFNITTSCVVRLQTLLAPIFSNLYVDTYYFFIPNRIIWSHWKEFMGEAADSPWLPQTEYSIPSIKPPESNNQPGWYTGTIADYLGIPPLVNNALGNWNFSISALPFRAYAAVMNEWFRDENLTDPLNIPVGDTNVEGSNGSNYITDVVKGGQPFKAAKYHDYFTSALPNPQRSQPISIFARPIGENDVPWSGQFNNYVPVMTRDVRAVENTWDTGLKLHNSAGDRHNLKKQNSDAQIPDMVRWNDNTNNYNLVPDNLWADVGGLNLSINQLRLAFQLQKFYEKNARGGVRYRELLREHFGVTSEDARMMIPEYLGGHRFPLQIHQIANTSSDEDNDSFLGDLGAMSNSSDVHEDFIKSFSEHGWLLGIMVCRYEHTYAQGLEKMWTRDSKLSYYWPVFQSLGELPLYKRELYLDGSADTNDVFGYQEAWSEYRFKPNRVSGFMRPQINQSLAVWNSADYYTQMPSLSDAWIREDKSNIDRSLAVTSVVAHQLMCDFYVKNICTRAMPMYSIPGLIDHH